MVEEESMHHERPVLAEKTEQGILVSQAFVDEYTEMYERLSRAAVITTFSGSKESYMYLSAQTSLLGNLLTDLGLPEVVERVRTEMGEFAEKVALSRQR